MSESYLGYDFSWHAAMNVSIRNMALSDTSHILTFPISDMPNVEEFLDHVNSTKSPTSRSAYWYLSAIRKGVYRCVMDIFMQW